MSTRIFEFISNRLKSQLNGGGVKVEIEITEELRAMVKRQHEIMRHTRIDPALIDSVMAEFQKIKNELAAELSHQIYMAHVIAGVPL